MDPLGSSLSVAPTRPRVSIGVPVYNGERYLATALQSVIDSTFGDWEMIVSDNASTDGTVAIVESFMARDPRICLRRNPSNIGALPNFNAVVHAARGEFFKWLAYDDVLDPTMLERCVEVLDRDPSVVLSNGRFREIDGNGATLRDEPYQLDLTSRKPHRRLSVLMGTDAGHPILYGLIRLDVLRQTHLLASYHGSDRALLAELALRGRIWETPDILWSSREHPDRSVYVRSTVAGWDRPDGHRLPTHLVITRHMARIIASSPLSVAERLRCGAVLAVRVAERAPSLVPTFLAELKDAVRTITHRASSRDRGAP